MILQLIFAGIFKIASTRLLKNDLKSLQTNISFACLKNRLHLD